MRERCHKFHLIFRIIGSNGIEIMVNDAGVISGVNWNAVRMDYLTGKFTHKDLGRKYDIDWNKIRSRCYREQWNQKLRQLDAKVQDRMVLRTLSKADLWVESQHQRVTHFREKIMESLDSTQGPIDPQALDQLTKAEMRVDDMGRRALGLVDPKALDITSGGMPLGAFGAALESIKGMVQRGEVKAEDVDVDRLADGEIIRDVRPTDSRSE